MYSGSNPEAIVAEEREQFLLGTKRVDAGVQNAPAQTKILVFD